MAVLISQASLPQQKALAIVPKCSSLLSLLGSFYIVYDVLRMRRPKAYHRLMLGMSIFDCMASSAWFFTTWPIPPEVFPAWGAMGTQATCTMQGYFAQLSISAVIYNGCLSAYYLLVIYWGWSDDRLRSSRMEYLFHFLSISFGLVTASCAAAMGLLNPIGWDCWISSVPFGCQESWSHNGETTCIRGDNANLWQWIFFYIPLWMIILFVGVAMALIVTIFRQQEKAIARWDHPSSLAGMCSTDRRRQSHLAKMAKDTLWQAVYYVGCFLLTWICPTILRIHELLVDEVYYHWVLLSAMFVPSQGMWTFLVYVRPRYQKICADRQTCRDRHQKMRQAVKEGKPDYEADPTLTTTREGSAWLGNSSTKTATNDSSNKEISKAVVAGAEAKEEEVRISISSKCNNVEEEEELREEDSTHTHTTIGSVLLQGKRSIGNFVRDMAQAVKEGDRGLGSVHHVACVSKHWESNDVVGESEGSFACGEEGSFACDEGGSLLPEQLVSSVSEQGESVAGEKDDDESLAIDEGSMEFVKNQLDARPRSHHSSSTADDILLESLRSILCDMADQSSRTNQSSHHGLDYSYGRA